MNIYERTAIGVILGVVVGHAHYASQRFEALADLINHPHAACGEPSLDEAASDALAEGRLEGYAKGYDAAVTAAGPCKCCKCEACQCNAVERQKARSK